MGALKVLPNGEFDDAGYMRITDRKKDLLITAGGKNISPTNIEVLLEEHALISNAVAVGDRRPYISALLTLDAGRAAEFARQHDIAAPAQEPAVDPQVRAEIQRHVDAINTALAQVEQVRRWQLLPTDFRAGEELTPHVQGATQGGCRTLCVIHRGELPLTTITIGSSSGCQLSADR